MNNQRYTIKNLLQDESFRKWVRGEASVSQKQYWDSWIIENDKNRDAARKAMQEMAGFALDPQTNPNRDEAWKRFNKRLKAEGKGIKHKSPNVRGGAMFGLKWIYRMAAGILIILTAGLTVYYGYPEVNSETQSENALTQHRILTNYGEQKTIKLGDGSQINLNANSEMVYRVNSESPTDITVELNGEAFFSVSERTRPNQLPFKVITDDGVVRVLGTEFSVSTWNDKTRVVLEEGSVEVTSYHVEHQKRRQLILKPNHMAEFDNTSDTLLVKWVNTAVYTSWKAEDLVFDHTPLPEVLKRIEYTFGVTIKIKDPTLKKRKLSGTIENSKMNVILSTLSQTLSTPVEIDGEIVYIGE